MTCSSSYVGRLQHCQRVSTTLMIHLESCQKASKTLSQSKQEVIIKISRRMHYTVSWLAAHIVQCVCRELINKQSLIRRDEGSLKAN